MNIEDIRKIADEFFEFPTEDKRVVTLNSAICFAKYISEFNNKFERKEEK